MALSIDVATKVITVPRADLTPVGGNVYEMDVDDFRLALKAWEASEAGQYMPDTHRHNTEVSLAGLTLARTVEIINGYTITFSPNEQWAVNLTGANNNIAAVTNVNQVSVRSNNSAGLIVNYVSGTDPDSLADAVMNRHYEGTLSLQDMARLFASLLFGKVSGAATNTVTFRDLADSKDRVVVTVDADGNRSAVTIDPS